MAWKRQSRHGHDHRHRTWAFARSGWATALVIATLLLGFGVVWRAHQRAKFHQFTATVIPPTISAPMPGGQEAMLLSRVALVNDAEPEFVSTTVLPGIGMQILQTTVAVPDQPTQDLLDSAPLSDAARMPVTSIDSAPFHLRVSDHHLQEKSTGDDLISFLPATDTLNQTLVDGGQATGTFKGSGAKSGISVTLEVTLSGRQIDLIARATNETQDNRYVVFEWMPRFAAPEHDLNRLSLTIPSHVRVGGGAGVNGTDFSTKSGQRVGNAPFDVRFANLGHDLLTDGTFVRLQEADQYFLRILGMGDSLRSVRAKNDPATHSLMLALSSEDPSAEPEQRDQILRSGQHMQWHLRMEVLAVNARQAPEIAH